MRDRPLVQPLQAQERPPTPFGRCLQDFCDKHSELWLGPAMILVAVVGLSLSAWLLLFPNLRPAEKSAYEACLSVCIAGVVLSLIFVHEVDPGVISQTVRRSSQEAPNTNEPVA